MKLKNLQIQFHGKDHLEHRITYVNENGTQCRETLCSGEKFAQHVINCLEDVPELRKERDEALDRVIAVVDHILCEINQSASAVITKPLDCMTDVYALVYGLAASATARPDATQPQLSEIRYVLHGDIQPCSVLYSDDTTTLLRLDEGDIMCETDTIEWSDSVTYRCQGLLRGTGVVPSALHRCSVALSQLVRDERILLNDNGHDEFPQQATAALPWKCLECRNDVAPDLSLCPTCHTKVPRADEYFVPTHLSSQPKQER